MGVSNHFQLTQNACFDELIPIGVDELIPIGVDELIPMDVSDLFSRPINSTILYTLYIKLNAREKKPYTLVKNLRILKLIFI
jgi:hypothetical protein